MGCLNADNGFEHWFANIHLSGLCNRSCYFCIGQHMMSLDRYNVLNEWPLPNLEEFLSQCKTRQVKEICLTGTNTDPALYRHQEKLCQYLRDRMDVPLAIRTNAVKYDKSTFSLWDKASITLCSFDSKIYKLMMGSGCPPDLKKILQENPQVDIKINIVLGRENVDTLDFFDTLRKLSSLGIKRVNLREPYGQPHIGNPMPSECFKRHKLGMPLYEFDGMEVMYWDVHYVEVESVNLYANGRISVTYPITKGHDDKGEVHEQSFFPGGRIVEQWV